MDGYLKSCQQWPTHFRKRELLKVERSGFLEIGNRFVNGMALADCTDFRAFGHV